MTAPENSKPYDLEERTYEFAKQIRAFVKRLPRIPANFDDARQLVRASGSVGANYLEANEALSKKDFVMRVKIARKEAKECRFFLRLLDTEESRPLEDERQTLIQESVELRKILSAILGKSE